MPPARSLLIKDLTEVPEVQLQELTEEIAYQIAKINSLNHDKADHFIELLREHRADLTGLPFLLGEDARLQMAERVKFAAAVRNVRDSMRRFPARDGFWKKYGYWKKHLKVPEDAPAVAALTQMLATDDDLRPGLIDHIARCDKPEATQALVRMAIFAPEQWVRRVAGAVLEQRDTRSASDILRQGLRYPWPSVATHAAELIVRLERADLAPELAKMLEEPDPRLPVARQVAGKNVYVVRELVRINHLRNCLLCHPPGNTPDVVRERKGAAASVFVDPSLEVLTDHVPPPSEFTAFSERRGWSPSRTESPREIIPGRLIRADVTYLRQDFSLLQEVAKGDPGPRTQRFDFLVRDRVLSEEEARAYQAAAAALAQTSPYHQAARAALRTLRELAPPDAGPTVHGWGPSLAIAAACLVLLHVGLAATVWRRRAGRRAAPSVASLSAGSFNPLP
jgi:hypothetical protein